MLKKVDIQYIKTEMEKIKKFFSVGKYETVIDKTKKLLKKDSSQVVFYNYIGLSYKQLGKLDEAIQIFKKGLKTFPYNQSLLNNIATVYRGLDKLSISEDYFKRALKINSDNVSTLVNYGNLKRDKNEITDAISIYEKARLLNPNLDTLLINLAGTYSIAGEFEKAKEVLNDMSKRFPENTLSDKMFSSIHKYEKNDTHQINMIEKDKITDLDNEKKMILNFALAKSYDDQKDYQNASKHFLIGNDLKFRMFLNYNFNKIEKNRFEVIKQIFQDVNFDKISNKNKPNLIFIVGLPRSGTTLTHQIISSHSNVYGAGELPILNNYLSKKVYDDEFQTLFKNSEKNIDKLKKISDDLKNYFHEYDDNLIILDKSPLNFEWIGFIKILFPSAKVVHCTRNLKDTALSIYKNAFDGSSLPWSYSQDHLVEFINLYKDLMNFWNNKIPNEIYSCNYENLVNDSTEEIPKLIKFLNLEWEENCLDHTKNKTLIKTVSISQARKSIYKSSVNLNDEYKNHLEFLKKL